jgi:putative zinc finger protein
MTEAALDHALLQQLVAAFADDELPPGEARVVQEHLGTCARCQRELALQHRVSSALAQEPARAASAGLHRRIERIGLPTSRRGELPWGRWAAPAAAALVACGIVGGAALVSIGIGGAGALLARGGETKKPTAGILLLHDAVADCRRVMGRNFPRKADLQAVGEGLPFPVRALDRPGTELFSTWKTTLAGSPAAGLAYRWRGIVVVQYVVEAELVRQQPEIGDALRAAGYYAASEQKQEILAFLADGSATLLVADAPAEELRRLIL